MRIKEKSIIKIIHSRGGYPTFVKTTVSRHWSLPIFDSGIVRNQYFGYDAILISICSKLVFLKESVIPAKVGKR
jgi:hypothetical protein